MLVCVCACVYERTSLPPPHPPSWKANNIMEVERGEWSIHRVAPSSPPLTWMTEWGNGKREEKRVEVVQWRKGISGCRERKEGETKALMIIAT